MARTGPTATPCRTSALGGKPEVICRRSKRPIDPEANMRMGRLLAKCPIFAVIRRNDQKHAPAIVRSVGDDGAVDRAAYWGAARSETASAAETFSKKFREGRFLVISAAASFCRAGPTARAVYTVYS